MTTRRLAAILAADVVGFSKLVGEDEAGTLEALREIRINIVNPILAEHGGRIFKLMGDGLLAEFPSAVQALRAAMGIQEKLHKRNGEALPVKPIDVRIGVHQGDVIVEGSDLLGDGVNIAARLEALAEPGGICISGRVHEDSAGKIALQAHDMGDQQLKNIARPVRAYRVSVGSSPKADAGKPALALPDKPSIAVLPFQNLSGDRDDYFGDGIAEDIITALSRLRGLFVIARNSTFAYRDRTPDVRQVARDLGVRYVLEGSVRRAADRLRVTAQLIDGTTGAHVWAERYDRALADVFVVQDEITASVVASTEEQVYAAEHTLVQSRAPESLDAWGCVIRAMPYVWPWVTQDNETGADLLKRALELAPGYARANSLLAWVWAARAHLGLAEPTGTLATAVGMAQQAILLDPDDAWAHLAAGYVHMVSRRTRSAREELSEAIDRNPSFALAHMVLGSTFAYAGLVEDGLRHLELAMRLSPHDPSQGANLSTTGTCHFMAGRYADAVELQRRAVQLRPGFGTAWRSLAAAAGLAGDLDTGAAALANARRLQPNLTLDWVKQYHPIVQPQDRARYIEGLRRAGLS